MAVKGENSVTVMIWNYHDMNNLEVADSKVEVTINDLPVGKVLLTHYRIDQKHSNSYNTWKEIGSPQHPVPQQIADLERTGQLMQYAKLEMIIAKDGKVLLNIQLPRQAVSLLKLSW